jgi:hypothetical protein
MNITACHNSHLETITTDYFHSSYMRSTATGDLTAERIKRSLCGAMNVNTRGDE